MNPNTLSPVRLTELAEMFRLLGDPSRLKILVHLLDGSKPVTQIAEAIDLSQSLVSHHLRLLRSARLVRGERHSRHIFYEIADKHISGVLTDMIEHVFEEDVKSSGSVR